MLLYIYMCTRHVAVYHHLYMCTFTNESSSTNVMMLCINMCTCHIAVSQHLYTCSCANASCCAHSMMLCITMYACHAAIYLHLYTPRCRISISVHVCVYNCIKHVHMSCCCSTICLLAMLLCITIGMFYFAYPNVCIS